MATNIDRYKTDLERLSQQGSKLFLALQAEHDAEQFDKIVSRLTDDLKAYRSSLLSFSADYQAWYSEAKAVVRQLLPDRLDDFVQHYQKPKSRKNITYENYRIEDCLQDLIITRDFGQTIIVEPKAAIPHMQQQVQILAAVRARFDTSLFDIRQLVQADLFDSELESARELCKRGFLRAAGAIAGVVLEKHLALVVANHKLKAKKSHPTISDFNDTLKNTDVLDVPEWRRVQRLGDLRNLCDHNKHREPTLDEIGELIDGVDKVTKTLF